MTTSKTIPTASTRPAQPPAQVARHGRRIESVTFHFAQSEAQGTVILTRDAYGLQIQIDGRMLCAIDLFPQSPCGAAIRPVAGQYPQLALFTGQPGDEALGFVRWLAGTVETTFHPAVELDREGEGAVARFSLESPEAAEATPLEMPAAAETKTGAVGDQTAFVYLETAIVVPHVNGLPESEIETRAAIRLGEMLVDGDSVEFCVEVE